MANAHSYKILGLQPGAGQAEIKQAYRQLAKKYHPDVNPTAGAAEKFLEITLAYDELLEVRPVPYKRNRSYAKAEEIIRQERENERTKARAREKTRVREKARAHERQRVKDEEEADRRFRESWGYDLLLLSRYVLHGLILLGSIAAVVVPVILGCIIEPAVFVATIYFVVIGVFGIWYIYGERKTWFRLGSFNTNKDKLVFWLKRMTGNS